LLHRVPPGSERALTLVSWAEKLSATFVSKILLETQLC